MIQAATAYADPNQLDAFVGRSQQLGRRHADYGVTTEMYTAVVTSLIATLRDSVGDFDESHERAWTKLFALVAETMLGLRKS